LLKEIVKGDIVLFKGSRGLAMENIVNRVKGLL
jgi:UDP-N-acetylmuramyl pentapeptide synthase